ncbi:MAG: prolyl oligopeptidase family serine peptidase [Flavobacteriales bacterium]
MNRLILLLFLALTQILYSQKTPLDHSVYDSWKGIYNAAVSADGNFITYEINPQEGDGVLHIFIDGTYERREFPRGKNPQISPSSQFVVFKVVPQYDTIRKMKIDKKKKEDFPKDSLAVHVIRTNTTEKFPNLLSYKVPNESSEWLAFMVEEKKIQPTTKTKKCFLRKKPQPQALKPEKLKVIYVYNPVRNQKHSIDYGSEYEWSEQGEMLAVVKQKKNKEKESDSCYAIAFDSRTNKQYIVMAGKGIIKNIATDREGQQLSFVYSPDTTDRKLFKLYTWSLSDKTLKLVSDTVNPAFPDEWTVSGEFKPKFSYDGKRIFFGSCPKPPRKAKDTIPEEEKVKLDIWHWSDPLIQPEQLKKLNEAKNKSYLAVFNIATGTIIQLADEQMETVSLPEFSQHNFAMGETGKPYEKLITWEGWYSDIYSVNLETGERKKILEKHAYRPHLSPNGAYLVYFKDSLWHSYAMKTGERKIISDGITYPLYQEDNDVPTHAQPYGFSGFTGDSLSAIINDKYDLWWVSLNGSRVPLNLTSGRNERWSYGVRKMNYKEPYLPYDKPLFVSALNENNKRTRFGYLKEVKSPRVKIIREEAEMIVEVKKAQSADKLIYRSSTFNRYPEIVFTNIEFSPLSVVTHTNPHQKDYFWGTVELVEWKSPTGETLKGLFYQPENRIGTAKMPLLVYYYEKYSDMIHRHYAPAPSASVINPTEYLSRGYAVFIPDITYKIGEPAQSAYNSIMSGTDYILANYGFIDENRLGLQGQSWGGYQTAMFITMTNRFKAAMAGAPVSNMTSAYGGVRWGTGLSRMFQYEKGQSRLGKNIWEDRDRYLRNSPLFYLDKVNTPLLIMHNDEDGAVPWYQGIELYMGLRRLERPVWMLNYNNEDHNLMKRHNRKDLSIRMQQFFDYYLMDKPMPEWMKFGRPAVEKETNTAY